MAQYYRRFLIVRRSTGEFTVTHAILKKYQQYGAGRDIARTVTNAPEDTATFMILGKVCTRHCGFCAIASNSQGEVLRADEPERVAFAAKELGLKYVVITSVTRDDLEDEGAAHYARTIRAVQNLIPGVKVEILTPDFHAREDLIARVLEAEPDVFNHNLETVERLQRVVRPQADYLRSLNVLKTAKRIEPKCVTKSGLILGLGETEAEVLETGRQLLASGVSILTLGQYLRPTSNHIEVRSSFLRASLKNCRSASRRWGSPA